MTDKMKLGGKELLVVWSGGWLTLTVKGQMGSMLTYGTWMSDATIQCGYGSMKAAIEKDKMAKQGWDGIKLYLQK